MPRLMIVAGPNGAGKSTLLHGIRNQAGHANVLYVGPHRAMRKQQVQQRHLMGRTLSFESVLSDSNVPSMEGLRIFDGGRDPWGYDESANYLKHTLCQIEVDRQQAIANRVDRDGEIRKDTLVDPWAPLREMTGNLLPHMSFERIDATNRDAVRVMFRVHRLDVLVDLDDLSSGEKSILQMFYPLVEREIKHLVREIDAPDQNAPRPEACVLIDEPELHLHPNLQIKVLDYLRVLVSKFNLQVIVATHSPTVVDAATFDELFLLRPVELVETGENQLVQIADSEERLVAMRQLFGATHNLTSMLPVVVVEGKADDVGGRAVSDRKLYRALHPGFDRVTLIAGGGKSECIALRKSLQPILAAFSPNLRVVALLDRDLSEGAHAADHLLPVSMIENFLIDPDVIYEAIESVRERTKLSTVDDVTEALTAVLDAAEPREVARRVSGFLGSSHFHPPSEPDTIEGAAEAYVAAVAAKYSKVAIEEATTAARQAVQDVTQRSRRREEYDGKRVLKDFFRAHLQTSTLSHPVFLFYAARRARRRKAVGAYFDQFISGIGAPK